VSMSASPFGYRASQGSIGATIILQTTHGRRTVVVDGEADPRWLFARGLFPRVGHLGTMRVSRSRAPVVYYTRTLLDLLVQLRDECAPSHDNLQRVFSGEGMPDHRGFNEMLLQYQVLAYDALSEYALRLGVELPCGCPACFQNPFKHMQVDACFKFWKQVRCVVVV
jgi:hypothetical protein